MGIQIVNVKEPEIVALFCIAVYVYIIVNVMIYSY